jgi:hypothetical protein
MASSVILAMGSKLYRKNPTSSVYEEVVQCKTMAIPGITQEWIEITNHSSTGGFKEWAPGLKDVKEMTVDIVWNPRSIAMHATIYDDANLATPLLRTWGLILPNALDGWQFDGFLSAPTGNLGLSEAVTLTFSMRVSGNPVRITTGSAGLS